MYKHKKVLYGFEQADDAGVYLLDDGNCLIQTVDFFTPIVDDPYDFGKIAAANSLSDIYAMGGRPISALSIVAFPISKLGPDILAQILKGGIDKAHEADVPIIGGHSIDDAEPKFGLMVNGIATRDQIVTKKGAQPGDILLLTKPLGSGIYTTALKQGKATVEMSRAVVEIMSRLNRGAGEAMVEVGVNACTDISGFGLLGHLHEMMEASDTAAMITASQIPTLPDLEDMAFKGAVAGGSLANLRFAEEFVDWQKGIGELTKIVIADAQTSGGLLIACPAKKQQALDKALAKRGVHGETIGVVFDGPTGSIAVVP